MPYAAPNHRPGGSERRPRSSRRVKTPDDGFYSRARWRKFRRYFLANNQVCVACKAHGIVTPATEVDHIVPLRDDPARAYDVDNMQALCHSCHSRKTSRERWTREKLEKEK